MREDNQTFTEQPSSGQVIDVRVTPAPQATSLESTEPESRPLIPTVEAAGDPSESEGGLATPPETVPNNEQSASTDAQVKSDSNTVNNTPPPQVPAAHKTASPVLAIVSAVVVAVGLAAVTVYAYMQTTQEDSKTNSSQAADTVTSNEVKKEDVDQATGEVDNALDATDEADFPESELTDNNLGL